MRLVFATNNQHKLDEIKKMLDNDIELLSLADIGCTDEIPETGETLEANSLQKAKYIYEKYGLDCFADDTGLEVEALNGEPGVFSARYAGPQRSAADNMAKLLTVMGEIKNRNARFRTVVSLIVGGNEKSFEGIVEGEICSTASGAMGFGYDPIFKPKGYDVTFAEMDLDEKNSISHRGRAVQKLVDFLNTL